MAFPPRRKPVQHEKFEQANIVQLAKTIGAEVWVLGTRRSAGKPCPKCGTFVAEHQGTRQTPGHPDLVMFLPLVASDAKALLYWETKRADGGRTSMEQIQFGKAATAAGVDFGIGCFDDFITWLVRRGYCRANQFPHYRQPAPPDADRELSGDAASAALQRFMSTRFPQRET